jgi:hypothetical protein
MGTPPTQLVGISTLGTERYDKFPYSMQNMMGGKLQTRRQVEEALVNAVKKRVVEPPLDYTIIKVIGEEKKLTRGTDSRDMKPMTIAPGDVLDDPSSVDAVVETIVQAVAYQPSARNATFSISGGLPFTDGDSVNMEARYDYWQEQFLCLDGPEVWRTVVSMDRHGPLEEGYDQLVEYVKEWGDLVALSGKGLTTPIRSEHGIVNKQVPPRTILKQDGVQLLFLPTATGRNYMSREEEAQREMDRRRGDAGSTPVQSKRKTVKEGGIEVVVELVQPVGDDRSTSLRVRARRCNYSDDAVIKELSEKTILKRLAEALEVWSNIGLP